MADELPTDTLTRAWARAFRHPGEPISGHEDVRVVALPGGIVATITLDEIDGRFARVSVRGFRLTHDQAVPIVSRIYLAGGFRPFSVDSIVGADGETLHYAIDLDAYKESRAEDAASQGDLVAAVQLACPLWALARTWDLDKVRRRDPRTIKFLSDRFLVPERWIVMQMELFLSELDKGFIDERGLPRPGH